MITIKYSMQEMILLSNLFHNCCKIIFCHIFIFHIFILLTLVTWFHNFNFSFLQISKNHIINHIINHYPQCGFSKMKLTLFWSVALSCSLTDHVEWRVVQVMGGLMILQTVDTEWTHTLWLDWVTSHSAAAGCCWEHGNWKSVKIGSN